MCFLENPKLLYLVCLNYLTTQLFETGSDLEQMLALTEQVIARFSATAWSHAGSADAEPAESSVEREASRC